MCVWRSMRPGMSQRPSASRIRSPVGRVPGAAPCGTADDVGDGVVLDDHIGRPVGGTAVAGDDHRAFDHEPVVGSLAQLLRAEQRSEKKERPRETESFCSCSSSGRDAMLAGHENSTRLGVSPRALDLGRRHLAQQRPEDRRRFMEPGTPTTDDPRHVPIPPGARGPEGVTVLRGGRVFDGTGAPARARRRWC